MTMRRRISLALFACAATLGSVRLGAQTVVSSTSAAVTIAPPTEAQYDAASVSSLSGTSSVVAKCDNGSGDCSVKLSSSGMVLDLEWEFVSVPSGNCVAPLSATTFRPIVGSTVIVTVQVNKSCTMNLAFRVKTLSYTTHIAPNPLVETVSVTVTKP